jgi:hypothetical protein
MEWMIQFAEPHPWKELLGQAIGPLFGVIGVTLGVALTKFFDRIAAREEVESTDVV